MSSHNQHEPKGSGFTGFISAIWKKTFPDTFRWNLEDSFQPQDIEERLLPGEDPILEIHLAWYRDIFGHVVFERFHWLLLITVAASLVLLILALQDQFPLWSTGIPWLILLGMALWAIKDRIEYNQWRLVRTNYRFIISIPVHGSFPLVDNIELKGMPNVIDTNWSKNPVWRVFQFFTGARDVYISLAAYKFIEGTAKVGDALIFPDVMPKDVFALKKIVFMK